MGRLILFIIVIVVLGGSIIFFTTFHVSSRLVCATTPNVLCNKTGLDLYECNGTLFWRIDKNKDDFNLDNGPESVDCINIRPIFECDNAIFVNVTKQ